MYCKRLGSLLDQVVEKYPQKVKIAFKNFPVRSHKYAETAARAALAAGKQGKFWPFHDKLFENYNRLTDDKVREIARELELEMAQFDKDWKDPDIAAAVQSDLTEGNRIGVRSVPTVFINGKQVKRRTLDGMSEMIDKELGEGATIGK